MSHLSTFKTLVLIPLSLVVLGGCSGSGGVDSEHDLVPTQETHVTDTNTTPDTNGTQPDDSNSTTGGGSDDGNATEGGGDTNTTDVTPPVITLNGEANMTLEQNATYTEPGAVAVDSVDGRVPVSISGIVNTATVGHYVVTYSATDRAGNQARVTRNVAVTSRVPVLTALNLECNATTLNIGEKATLTLTGTYSDGSSMSIDTNIDYALPTEHVTLNGNIFTATKDGNVTIRARVGKKHSNLLALNIVWVVNGHVLPPDPDPKINDETLGGVDANHNGVRDDVERWIYKNFSKNIHRTILLDEERFYQMTMVEPTEKARDVVKYSIKTDNCALHLKHIKQRPANWLKVISRLKYESINIKKRVRKYLDYNLALSGGVYGSGPKDWNRDACSEEVRKVLEEMGK